MSVLDKDGNTYNTVVIGTQEWLTENLKVTHYADGSVIPLITDADEWSGVATPINPGTATSTSAQGYWVSAQTFTITNKSQVYQITMIDNDYNLREGSPNYNLRCSLYSTSAGLPTTKIADSTNVIAASVWGDEDHIFTFASTELTAGVYAFVFSFENIVTKDLSNYAKIGFGTTPSFDGVTMYLIGSTWNIISGDSFDFQIDLTANTDAYCYYDNDTDNQTVYGNLYNFYAVNHGVTVPGADLAYLTKGGIKETGWRIPTQTDFATLSTYLGGDSVSGGHLKEAGTTHWLTPNTGADNSSGFTALPGGWRIDGGTFENINNGILLIDSNGSDWYLWNNSAELGLETIDNKFGFSVRLVRDYPPVIPETISLSSQDVDFNDPFNVQYSIGDVRDITFGSNNKTYTLTLPLTNKNKKFLKFINEIAGKSEPNAIVYLYKYESLIIYGKLIVLSHDELKAKIIISADDWMDPLANSKLAALDMSSETFVFSIAIVEDSWTATYPAYRYPMIDFGGLMSGEKGPTANWYATDFIPMISLYYIINTIFKNYTIVSTWLNSTYIKELYILANEKVAQDSFSSGNGLSLGISADTVNTISGSSPVELVLTLSKDVVFDVITLDEASGWDVDAYTVVTAGTYHFRATLKFRNTAVGNTNLTISGEQVMIRIRKNGTIVKEYVGPTYSGTELIDNLTYILDSEYFHCDAGDTITLECWVYCFVIINSGTQSVTLSIEPAYSTLINSVNKYVAIGDTVGLAALLPDMSQLDFLATLRDIFNLRFWMDKSKGTVYIEPWDKLLTNEIVDLTSFVDFKTSDLESEMISQFYKKNIILKWKDDTSDKAIENYLTKNTFTPGRKNLTLESLFAKAGIDEREHEFSGIVTGYNSVIENYDIEVPRIWAEVPVYPFTAIYNRLTNFNTRLVHWAGLTAGYNWTFEGTTQTSYPKIEGVDWSYIYTEYWQKFFHYMDKGKLFTFKIKTKPGYLTQFMTVVNDATKEGFRPTYKITINDEDHYFFMQKIVGDGDSAQIEMILKT
jgi:uncharacterized protein (TIGR02145 family)